MTVIVISEDNHENLAVAIDMYSAVSWLIDTEWISAKTEASWDDKTGIGMTIEEKFGENWKEVIKNFTPAEFEKQIYGFWFEERVVFEYKGES